MPEELVERSACQVPCKYMCKRNAQGRDTYIPEPPPIKATSSNWLAGK